MQLNRDDLIKYYELRNHYNETSANIAIIGDKKHFEKRMKAILKVKPYDWLSANEDKTRYIIIKDNIETSYWQIEKLDDLKGLHFRKYM